MLDWLLDDARYGLRMLRKNPGFTAITIATLALGIGANTALFSVVDAILLRPLPYPDSDRLLLVMEKPPQDRMNSVSAANFLDWRDQNRVFAHLAATDFATFDLSVKGSPDRAFGLRVSADFFDLLGIPPAVGRTFAADDERPGAACVTVLSHGSFQRRWGGDRGAIGQTLMVDGNKCTVIGVMPARFRFVGGPEMWVPLALDPAKVTRDFHYLAPLGRLRPGVSLEQARAQMVSIGKNIERAYPKSNKGWSVTLEPLHALIVEGERTGVLVLFGAVALVLLIGCVNVANLLLAKAAVRQRELAIRSSLGAGRGRLIAQVLVESVLLALAGGLLGVVLAFWLVRLTPSVMPKFLLEGMPEIAVDWRLLLFALGVSLLTGLLFGLAPAWRASKVDLQRTLKEAGRGSSSGSGSGRFRGALVAGEVALSLALLVGAGLMVRSMVAMYGSDPGFQPDNVLTMQLSMPQARYPGPQPVRSFDRQLLERVQALPGVRAASLSMTTPLQGSYFGMPFQVVGQPEKPVSERPGEPFQLVTHDYFRTMGITLRKGRFFTERDGENAPRVAVVNETFVKRYLSKVDPVGQRLRIEELISGQQKLGPEVVWEIVGVMANVKFGGLNSGEVPEIYVPLMQSPWPGGVLALRTAIEPERMTKAVRAVVRSLDKDMPITEVKTMRQIAGDSVAQPRLQTWIIGVFAVVALVLAALGIYGVMAYTVEQGTHDLGVRMALGARPADLLKMTLRRGLVLTAIGVAVGLAGSFALTRAMASLLYNVKPTDPPTFIGVALLLTAVALLATYIPARRAAAVDPMVALRWE
jgi:putative ABC transport system permease protein